MFSLDADRALAGANRLWDEEILPALCEYIRIPNLSPHYEADWEKTGHTNRAVALLKDWAMRQRVVGLTVEVVQFEGRTPVIFMDIPGEAPGTVLLYGHLDKQPEMSGWRTGLSPREPVFEGDLLYGRGGADDGYSTFASLSAVNLLQQQGIPHARCVVLIEACEESGSYDLPFYVDALAGKIGKPDFIVCLDSGCGNYDQLWMTTSLRGLVGGVLRVDILNEGVHSGASSGIVPDSFRILRALLTRIEDEGTGHIKLRDLYVKIPEDRIRQATNAAEVLGDTVFDKFPWARAYLPPTSDLGDLLLNKTWRPALTVIGADGLPSFNEAGNVLRPYTACGLSMRIPPGVDPDRVSRAMKKKLESNLPHGARVTFTPDALVAGWNAPSLAAWLESSLEGASQSFFGRPAMAMGEGGTIPFMGMLGKKFPEAQFLITGLLGPGSNAHGPNEFLHIPTGKRLTACIAQVLADHAAKR